jgi:hypothetical protein
MQVLLQRSETRKDIQCTVCNQTFRIYWERTNEVERATMRPIVHGELRHHHGTDPSPSAHPDSAFNLPQWSGAPEFSGAALLGGHSRIDSAAARRRI